MKASEAAKIAQDYENSRLAENNHLDEILEHIKKLAERGITLCFVERICISNQDIKKLASLGYTITSNRSERVLKISWDVV